MHFRLHSKYVDTEGHRKVAMSILLRHVGVINAPTVPYLTSDPQGDVLVMEGTGVQEYYE
jgi:hypothetical protein